MTKTEGKKKEFPVEELGDVGAAPEEAAQKAESARISEDAPSQAKPGKAKKRAAEIEDLAEDTSSFYWNTFLLLGGRLLNRTLDWYNGLFSLTPKEKVKVYRNLSLRSLKRHAPEEAMKYLKEWARCDKNDPEPIYQMGLALAAMGEHQRAVNAFDKVLRLRPNHPSANYRKCALLVKIKNFKEAIAGLTQVVADRPDDPRGYYLLGLSYDGDGQLEKGIEAMQKAVDLDPEEIKYHQHLGFMCVRRDDHKTAAEHFTKVMELERSQDDSDE
jgi:tetratricopeptide (TPR) repeat protein